MVEEEGLRNKNKITCSFTMLNFLLFHMQTISIFLKIIEKENLDQKGTMEMMRDNNGLDEVLLRENRGSSSRLIFIIMLLNFSNFM